MRNNWSSNKKQKIKEAQDEAKRVKFKSEERRKTQEAQDKAACLAAEVESLEKVRNFVHNDPESLSNRLRDFDNDPLELIPPSSVDKTVVSQPLPGLMENVQTSCGPVLSTNNTWCTVTSTSLIPPSTASETVVSQTHTVLLQNAQTICGTVLSTNNSPCTVTSSPLFQQPKSSVTFVVPRSVFKPEKAFAKLSVMDWRFTKWCTTGQYRKYS